ncbi:MAG: hypothetical protein DI536_28545 [Archangium gephyra]|uniref:Uncharacterized protein n=1 Tax=Archangium gephyra TaxID=48 RepID=A0A2W5SV70_9BACT|nr:MAG: hypothetical protein DI536_28545 [Archangium gephyra]
MRHENARAEGPRRVDRVVSAPDHPVAFEKRSRALYALAPTALKVMTQVVEFAAGVDATTLRQSVCHF